MNSIYNNIDNTYQLLIINTNILPHLIYKKIKLQGFCCKQMIIILTLKAKCRYKVLSLIFMN